tara:strand:+ start:706 stop:2013 length:1308 start_codon:yes stop_codon:yes gene_type:complete
MISTNKFYKNYNAINILITIFLLLLFYYKLYLEYKIPILGDELNSILIYSTNFKTLFLKNFPGNVSFFHLVGYIKSLLFGYELLTYRSISYLSVLLILWILKKLNYEESKILIFFSALILSNYTLTVGWYAGYNFTTTIFGLIFLLLKFNQKEKNNKIILLLLFVQFYNHLVNIYLVIPILITLFFYSKKVKFIRDFLIFFIIPSCIFYMLSIFLTGLAVLKVEQVNFLYIFSFIKQNLKEIIIIGFDRIFFYEVIKTANEFNLINAVKDLNNFDKIITITMGFCLIFSIYDLTKKKSIFSLIILLHCLIFVIFNKQPPARIFTGFGIFYLLVFFNIIENKFKKILDFKIFQIFSLFLLISVIVNLNFKDKIDTSIYGKDISYKENEISVKLLNEKCELYNQNFLELQKRNYYFNYLNICDQNFNLTEFLEYYRS